ncbi:hypothetical protein BLA29_010170, partial [Euroglyphus maynei]
MESDDSSNVTLRRQREIDISNEELLRTAISTPQPTPNQRVNMENGSQSPTQQQNYVHSQLEFLQENFSIQNQIQMPNLNQQMYAHHSPTLTQAPSIISQNQFQPQMYAQQSPILQHFSPMINQDQFRPQMYVQMPTSYNQQASNPNQFEPQSNFHVNHHPTMNNMQIANSDSRRAESLALEYLKSVPKFNGSFEEFHEFLQNFDAIIQDI